MNKDRAPGIKLFCTLNHSSKDLLLTYKIFYVKSEYDQSIKGGLYENYINRTI
jgi:hypothetical protein